MLGGNISCQTHSRADSRNRCEIHNPPSPACTQRRNGAPTQAKCGVQIDIERSLPALIAHGIDRLEADDTSGVNDDIETAKRFDRSSDKAIRCVNIGDVLRYELEVFPLDALRSTQLFSRNVCRQDTRAFAQELTRHSGTHAIARASYNGDLSRKSTRHL
jgi:hypothetical protein